MIYNLTQANPKSADILHLGGALQVMAWGNFDGATLNLNVSQDNSPELALSDYALTAQNIKRINLVANSVYNFELVTPGAAANVNISTLD